MSKTERLLSIFYKSIKGNDISVAKLANEYNVSTKSISRDLEEIKFFLAENRELVGNAELIYTYQDKVYRMKMDDFLSSKELVAIVKIIIGSRAFSKADLTDVVNKLKGFAVNDERRMLDLVINNEVYNYHGVRHDCTCVEDTLWQIVQLIEKHKEITVHYYKMNRDYVDRRICPVTVMFSEYYFYLIAFRSDDNYQMPLYFRIDRIKNIIEHKTRFEIENREKYDCSILRERCQFMFPGKLQTIRFEFSGPSVQAILDRLPTAKIIDKTSDKYLIEAEVYGDGIKMYLLSQGAWVKVISPKSFVLEMKKEIDKLANYYCDYLPRSN